MRPVLLLLAASLILASCATRSPPPQPAAQPKPLAVDPRLCAPAKAEPAQAGSIVQPETPEEKVATEMFLTAEAQAREWGREGWARARIALKLCD